MATKETTYKLNLSGGDITVKDRQVSEEIARRIITLIMGGNAGPGEEESAPGKSQLGHQAAQGDVSNPKSFMAHKRPSSELERLTCLAYYLTHFRETPAFKTRDLTKLNTEAAQTSFSNAAAFARNAVQAGWLAKAGGGRKQITTLGEEVVKALPDRDKVKTALDTYGPGRKQRRKGTRRKAA